MFSNNTTTTLKKVLTLINMYASLSMSKHLQNVFKSDIKKAQETNKAKGIISP